MGNIFSGSWNLVVVNMSRGRGSYCVCGINSGVKPCREGRRRRSDPFTPEGSEGRPPAGQAGDTRSGSEYSESKTIGGGVKYRRLNAGRSFVNPPVCGVCRLCSRQAAASWRPHRNLDCGSSRISSPDEGGANGHACSRNANVR